MSYTKFVKLLQILSLEMQYCGFFHGIYSNISYFQMNNTTKYHGFF